jgi:hypothetical protein
MSALEQCALETIEMRTVRGAPRQCLAARRLGRASTDQSRRLDDLARAIRTVDGARLRDGGSGVRRDDRNRASSQRLGGGDARGVPAALPGLLAIAARHGGDALPIHPAATALARRDFRCDLNGYAALAGAGAGG